MSATAVPVNEEFVLFERPETGPSEKTFKKQTVPYPDVDQLKDGEVIVKLLFASVDPYMRRVLRTASLGVAHNGNAVAEVVASKSSQWKVGDLFYDGLPWRRYTVHNLDRPSVIRLDTNLLSAHKLSPAIYLSALGMVSRTAYFGIRDVLQIHPKYSHQSPNGLTVVVSGAAGATGGFAIQFARLFGAKKIIGIAGGKDKCDFILKEYGADAAIDYKEYNTAAAIRKRLEELAPHGVDRYFDNTGGIATDAIFDVINKYARIAVCGQISVYNTDSTTTLIPDYLSKIIYKSATVQGFLVYDFVEYYGQFFEDMNKWINQGKIKDKQHIVEGFEKIPKAFVDLFAGANTGKVIIDCSK